MASGELAQLLDVALAQRPEDLVEHENRLVPATPLPIGTQQVFLGHHLEDRTDVLRHATVD